MANTYISMSGSTYQETKFYRNAGPGQRQLINKYKTECDVSDEHMYLILFKHDLDAVPRPERDKADTANKAMIVIAVLLLWNSLRIAMDAKPGETNVFLIFLSLGSFGLVCGVYYFGLLNPYKRALHEYNKRMKGMPEVPDFDEWCASHASEVQSLRQQSKKQSKKKGKRRKKKR